MVLRNFDIFEKFPDGSLTWRTCVFGQFEVERKLQELAEHSENEFLVVDILAGEPWAKLLALEEQRTKEDALPLILNGLLQCARHFCFSLGVAASDLC